MKNRKKYWKLGRSEVDTEYFDINKQGQLIVKEGNYQYNLLDLVEKFGTSLEVVFPFIVEQRARHLMETFLSEFRKQKYRGKFWYHYPMKVNQNKEFILPLITEGAMLETGSANELFLVKHLWTQNQFNPRIRVMCNGPKTEAYLNLISQLRANGLSIIPIIEGDDELDYVKKFSGDVGIRVNIVDVKVDSHWDKRIDQFGFTHDQLLGLGRIRNLKVLHYHVGSQTEGSSDLVALARSAMHTYIELKKINPGLDTLDLGGGFAIPYEKRPLYSVESMAKRLTRMLKKEADEAGIPHPNLIVEWGRHVVAPAQVTIFKVISEKNIPIKAGVKKWYTIDGSFMNDLLDTWAIHQKWHMVPVNHANAKRLQGVWLVGMSCDSDDKYTAGGEGISLPRLEDLPPGESLYFAVFDTGAYQDALESSHCLLSSPAKIIVQNGVVTLARKRETAEEVGKLFGW